MGIRDTRTCEYDSPIAPNTRLKALELCGLAAGKTYPGIRLLDFGCGGGRYLEMFSGTIPRENLVGVDVDEGRLHKARELGFRVERLDPEVARLPFPDKSFEIVFSSNVVEHIPKALYRIYLGEIRRVLVPGGRFVVGTPNYPIKRLYDLFTALKRENRKLMLYYLFDDPTHINRLSILGLERDLSEHFEQVHLEPTYLFLERRLKWLRDPGVRHRLRVFGYKLAGYCIRPGSGEVSS